MSPSELRELARRMAGGFTRSEIPSVTRIFCVAPEMGKDDHKSFVVDPEDVCNVRDTQVAIIPWNQETVRVVLPAEMVDKEVEIIDPDFENEFHDLSPYEIDLIVVALRHYADHRQAEILIQHLAAGDV